MSDHLSAGQIEEIRRVSLDIAVKYLESEDFNKLENWIAHCIAAFPAEARFHTLLGIALGSSGMHEDARKSFSRALRLSPFDECSMVNFITASFAMGDILTATELIKSSYDTLGNDSRSIIECTLIEAIRSGNLSLKDVPTVVLPAISNVHVIASE